LSSEQTPIPKTEPGEAEWLRRPQSGLPWPHHPPLRGRVRAAQRVTEAYARPDGLAPSTLIGSRGEYQPYHDRTGLKSRFNPLLKTQL
jgi:hypothetical protein